MERTHARYPTIPDRDRRLDRHRFGIGQALRQGEGYDLLIAADEPAIEQAAMSLRKHQA
jgi:hypothetical protein